VSRSCRVLRHSSSLRELTFSVAALIGSRECMNAAPKPEEDNVAPCSVTCHLQWSSGCLHAFAFYLALNLPTVRLVSSLCLLPSPLFSSSSRFRSRFELSRCLIEGVTLYTSKIEMVMVPVEKRNKKYGREENTRDSVAPFHIATM
jgi:hypothetical protein